MLGTIINAPATVSDIARRMGLSRQNVQRIANRLITDGFIETIDNPAHSRAKLCSLSALGKETMEEVTRRQILWANKISKNMEFLLIFLVFCFHLMSRNDSMSMLKAFIDRHHDFQLINFTRSRKG